MKKFDKAFLIIFVVIAIFGFINVTQAGQDNVLQNDGFAVSGGLLILSAGIGIGRIIESNMNKRGKAKK